MLIIAITLCALLTVAVAGLGSYARYSAHKQEQAAEAAAAERRTGPLPLAPVPAPEAESPECASVLDALPRELSVDDADVPRRALADPAPDGAVAWGDADHDPITVRCGITAPAELEPTSPLLEVSGVSWLEISEAGNSTFLAADRPVYIALSMPQNTGTGTLQDLSGIIREELPEQDVFP